jgi:DNA-binding transcriptional MerR regulator
MAQLISTNEAGEILGIAMQRLIAWQQADLIEKPTIQVGKRFFYTPDQVSRIKDSGAYSILRSKQARKAAKKSQLTKENHVDKDSV